MPYRRMNTARWGQAWWEAMTGPERAIYWYLESNSMCPACGLYEITLDRIARESGFPFPQVEKAVCHSLQPWVLYDRSNSLLFIRRFVRDQRSSANWMISVERALNEIAPHPFVKEFLQVNHMFKIVYRYPIDTLSIDTVTVTDTFLNSLDLLDNVSDEKVKAPPPREPIQIEPQPAEEKVKHHDHVYITDPEYKALCSRYGLNAVNVEIENLDSYLENNKSKREGAKAYTDHAKVVGTWIRSNEKGKEGGKSNGKNKGSAKGRPDYTAARKNHGGTG